MQQNYFYTMYRSKNEQGVAYIKLVVVGYDSAPEEGPARHCDCFVKKLPSLRGINGSQK